MFNDMINSGYFMYMAEKEGHDSLISTRTAKINAAIKDFKYIVNSGENPNDYIDSVLEKHGLTENMLTDNEVYKINHCINSY